MIVDGWPVIVVVACFALIALVIQPGKVSIDHLKYITVNTYGVLIPRYVIEVRLNRGRRMNRGKAWRCLSGSEADNRLS